MSFARTQTKAETTPQKVGGTSSQTRKEGITRSNDAVSNILKLQETVGNRAVSELLASSLIQAKLNVSSSNDPCEMEADRLADEAMTMTPSSLQHRQNELIQTKSSKPITSTAMHQTKSSDEASNNVLESEGITREAFGKSDGQPMESGLRSEMEAYFLQDFSNVRIHADANANELSEKLHADALTFGGNIFLRSGMNAPNSQQGKKLLIHELTHVVQQQSPSQISGVPDILRQESEPKETPAETEQPVSEEGEVTAQNKDTFFILWNFKNNSAELNSAFKTAMNQIVQIAKVNAPGSTVEIHGHASRTGPEELNDRLSEMRANAVAQYMLSQGLPSTQIIDLQGFGYNKPVADNKTPLGQSKNRRVEVKINLKSPEPPEPTVTESTSPKKEQPAIKPDYSIPKPEEERECRGVSCKAFNWIKQHWFPVISEEDVKAAIKMEKDFLYRTKYDVDYSAAFTKRRDKTQADLLMLDQNVEADARRRIFKFITDNDPSFGRMLGQANPVEKMVPSNYAR